MSRMQFFRLVKDKRGLHVIPVKQCAATEILGVYEDNYVFVRMKTNKPDRATMRPDCVLTWSEIRADCVRQMDEQT